MTQQSNLGRLTKKHSLERSDFRRGLSRPEGAAVPAGAAGLPEPSVITQECAFDMSMTGLETLQQDLVDVMDKLAPLCTREGLYLHPGPKALAFAEEHGEDARGCHNTDAHLRSSIIGRSETIVIVDGQPDLGEFGRIHFIDFDTTRGRKRVAQVMVMGE